MSHLSRRTELERPLSFGGRPGRLFASCGRWDDYLESVLPDGTGGESPDLGELRCLTRDTPWGSLDVRIDEGSDARVRVLALYLGDPERRDRSHGERLILLLSELVCAAPRLDFGDLLPCRPQPEVGHALPVHPISRASHPSAEGGHVQRAFASPPEDAAVPDDGEPSTGGETAMGENPVVSPDRHWPAGRAASTGPCVPTELHLGGAREMAARGQLHKALRALDVLLEHHPGQEDACELRKSLRLLERREKRRRKEPRNAQAHLEVGFSYLMVERNSDAIDALKQASRLSPRLPLADLLLGIALHREGRSAAAENAYRKAAELQPGDKVPLDLLAALRGGEPPPPLVESGRERRLAQVG